MKLVTDRIERISQYLQPRMQECFLRSCEMIQAEIDCHAGEIWEELNRAIKECLSRAAFMQKQNKKGYLEYLVFSFLRYGEYLDGPELRIDALDDGFYLDKQEAAGQFHPGFLQDRYMEDVDFLYKNAMGEFIRLQDYEWEGIKKEYMGFYHSILFQMMVSLTEPVMETVAGSGIPVKDEFKIVFGEYMGNGTVLYKRGMH